MAAIKSPNCSVVSGLVVFSAWRRARGGTGLRGTPVTAERLGSAAHCQIHPETLKRLRRAKNSPFKQGRDFRWAGLGKGKLQWNMAATDAALTNFRREPADAIENFDRKPQPAAG